MIKLIEPSFTDLSKEDIKELSSSRIFRAKKFIELLETGPPMGKYIPNSIIKPKTIPDLSKDFSLIKDKNIVFNNKLDINLNIEYQKEHNPNIQKIEIPSKYLLNLENTKGLNDDFLRLDDTIDNYALDTNAYSAFVFQTNVNVRKR